MHTVGVDLAAEPAKTAVARIHWSPGGAKVIELELGVDDDSVTSAVRDAAKAGIDCPFGWPTLFIDYVVAHHQAGHVVPADGVTGIEWRRRLAYRVTDVAVREATGLRPLSVAADRIAHTAMRCAALLAQLDRAGHAVDRSGAGVVVEVYPAASLQLWGLARRGYKGSANVESLNALVDAVLAAAPWLDLGPFEAACRRSDDSLDAVIAALTAKAAHMGLTTAPGPNEAAPARTEGWIALPNSPIAALEP